MMHFLVFRLTILCVYLTFSTGKTPTSDCRLKPDDFFNRHHFKITSNSLDYALLTRDPDDSGCPGHLCRRQRYPVREFSVEDAVRCFDSLSARRQRRPIHIAFIGDSIVRLHFMNFLRVLPDYDRQMASTSGHFKYNGFQEDRNVTFPLLDSLLVSFRWRPRIDEEIFEDFHRWWSTSENNQAPDFILIGTTAHYLVRYDDEQFAPSFSFFQIMLEKYLVPWMNKNLLVNSHQEIVWLFQSLPGNYRGPEHQYHSQWVNADKIEIYNRSIRRILSNTNITIWDSINEIVDEVIRSCYLTRVLRRDSKDFSNCGDFFHPGLGGLSLGTDLILNHLCYNV